MTPGDDSVPRPASPRRCSGRLTALSSVWPIDLGGRIYVLAVAASNQDGVRRSFAAQTTAFEDPTRAFGAADVVEWLRDNSPAEPGDVVLDVAAGTAIFARALAARVSRVIAVDITPEMLIEGRRAAVAAGVANIVFQYGDATELPFLDESFDRVVSRLALHHLPDPELAIREMMRVCRSGGTITIVDMVVAGSVQHRFNELEVLRDPSHVRALTPAELRQLVESFGAEVVHASSRQNVLKGERWLDQTATPPSAADRIRAAWRAELAGGSPTGMRPMDVNGEIEFVHDWDLIVCAGTTS